MGLLDNLFGGKAAAKSQYDAALSRTAGQNQATGTLNQGYGDASNYLDKIPGYLDNAKDILGGSMQYQDNAKGYYDSAKTYLDDAKGNLTTAASRLDPLVGTANQGFTQYGSLYGLGGADPTAAVRAQPGYQFSQDEGREQAMRSMLGNVGVNSGNAMQAVFDRGANIADTKWQQYAEGLKPFLTLAPQIAQIQGGYDAQKGVYDAQKGSYEAQKAGLEAGKTGIAAGQAGYEANKSGYATGQAGLETNLAGLIAQLQSGTANANANGLIEAQNAKTAASKNVFDAVMGGVKLAAAIPTGGMSLAGGFQGLGGNPNQSTAGYDKSGNYYNYG